MILRLKKIRGVNKMLLAFVHTLFFYFFIAVSTLKAQTSVTDSAKVSTLLDHIHAISVTTPKFAYKFCDSIINKNKTNDYKLACAYKGVAMLKLEDKEFSTAERYFRKALAVFRMKSIEDQVNDCHFFIADCLQYKGDLDEAIKQYKLTASLYAKSGDVQRTGILNNELARVLKAKGEFEKSLECFFESLKCFDKTKDDYGRALLYNNIGDLLSILGITKPAEDYILRGIKLAKLKGYTDLECIANESLGNHYINDRQLKKGLHHLEKSVSLITKASDLANETKIIIYLSVAKAHISNNNITVAESYLEKAAILIPDSTKTFEDGYYAIVKGELFFKKGDVANAEKEFSKALVHSKTFTSVPLRIEALEELRLVYAQTERYKLYFFTETEIKKLKTKIDKNGIAKKVSIYLLRNKFQKKEKEQEMVKIHEQSLLKRDIKVKNVILASLLLIIIFVSYLMFIYYKNNKIAKATAALLKQKNDLVEAKNTEIQTQKELLFKANETKDLIFTIIAHDLRNPLSQLQMILSLMETDDLGAEDFKTLLPKLSSGVKVTSETLDSLLYWAKTQMNGFKLDLMQHNLAIFINNEIKNYSNLLSEKNLSIVSNIPSKLNMVFDASIIRIIFRNLLTNAIKFSLEGNKIELNYSETSNFHYLSIKDFGVGMSEAQKTKLFSNLTNTTLGTNDEKGIGVGLIFCKDLVEKNNGEITVESILGKGSTFTVSIPK